MRSQRQLRVGEEIRHALAGVLLRGDVPWPQGVRAADVTVTEVQVSPDLKNATVFAMPLGGHNVKETIAVLNELVWFFRQEVAHAVKLRYTPKLRFSADSSFDYAERIEKILLDPVVAKDLDPHDD
jgi:ribosome-binding factor A